MFEPLRADPAGERFDPGERGLFGVSVGEDAGELHDFREPPAIVLSLDLDLEGDQPLIPGNEYTAAASPLTRDCNSRGIA